MDNLNKDTDVKVKEQDDKKQTLEKDDECDGKKVDTKEEKENEAEKRQDEDGGELGREGVPDTSFSWGLGKVGDHNIGGRDASGFGVGTHTNKKTELNVGGDLFLNPSEGSQLIVGDSYLLNQTFILPSQEGKGNRAGEGVASKTKKYEVGTDLLELIIGKSSLIIIEKACYNEDYINWKHISTIARHLKNQAVVSECRTKKMDIYNTLVAVLDASANAKKLTNVKNLVDITEQIRGLEKLYSELKFNDTLIEKASYMICDSKNFSVITDLVIAKYDISLAVVKQEWSQDEIAGEKIKVKKELKNFLHSFPNIKDTIMDIAENLKENNLTKDAKALTTLLAQNENDRKESFECKHLVQKLTDMKILFPMKRFEMEDKPFSVTQMSKIFRATSKSLFPNKQLALKEMNIASSNFKNVLQEVEINFTVKHENILPIMGCILQEHKRKLFIVMEYVQGSTLEDLMKERKLAKAQKLEIAKGITAALTHLHGRENSIIHADLKGSNVLIREGSLTPVVIDFGVSSYINKTSTVTQTSTRKLFGTVDFIAPELLLGKTKSATRMSDMWGLGVMFAQLFSETKTYKMPWTLEPTEDEDRATAIRVRMEDEETPTIVQSVDLSVKHVITRCLSYEEQERITSAELLNNLENISQLIKDQPEDPPNASFVVDGTSETSSQHSTFHAIESPSWEPHDALFNNYSNNHFDIEKQSITLSTKNDIDDQIGKIERDKILQKQFKTKKKLGITYILLLIPIIITCTTYAMLNQDPKVGDKIWGQKIDGENRSIAINTRSSSIFKSNRRMYGSRWVLNQTFGWSKTKYQKYPWIELELPMVQNISDVQVRGQFPKNTVVEIRAGMEQIIRERYQHLFKKNQVCFSLSNKVTSKNTIKEDCHKKIKAKFITLQIIGDDRYQLKVKYFSFNKIDRKRKFYNNIANLIIGIIIIALFVLLIIYSIFLLFTNDKKRNKNIQGTLKNVLLDGDDYIPDKLMAEQIENLSYCKKYEITKKQFTIDHVIGYGQFGKVSVGTVKDIYDAEKTIVAIRQVKTSIDEKQLKIIFGDLKIMSNLESHPNLVNLVGACTSATSQNKIYILLEYCAYGDLKTFLLEKRETFLANITPGDGFTDSRFTPNLLLSWCHQTANGMQYLESLNFMYGDLAAKNIFIDKNFNAKISDFGISKQIQGYKAYRKINRRVPWAWMSLDYLLTSKLNIKSNVWSFGIVVWEIYSLGSKPYGNEQYADIKKKLLDNYRLEPPEYMIDLDKGGRIYSDVMKPCWDANPENRPDFKHLAEKLEAMMESEEVDKYNLFVENFNKIQQKRIFTEGEEAIQNKVDNIEAKKEEEQTGSDGDIPHAIIQDM